MLPLDREQSISAPIGNNNARLGGENASVQRGRFQPDVVVKTARFFVLFFVCFFSLSKMVRFQKEPCSKLETLNPKTAASFKTDLLPVEM